MPGDAPDAVSEFFDDLAGRGHEPLLGNTSGTLRFDLVDGPETEPWYVRIDRGQLAVSHADDAADAVVRIRRQLMAAMVSGRVNATAAVLRGELEPHGDLGLLVSFQRIFPGPPDSRRAM